MKRDISKHLFSDVGSIDGEGITILPSSWIDVVPVLHTGSVPAMPLESPIVLNILDADFEDGAGYLSASSAKPAYQKNRDTQAEEELVFITF